MSTLKNLIVLVVLLFNFQYKIETKQLKKDLDKISINGKWFIDGKGRTVLFRGINAVKKEYPWYPNKGHVDMTNETQIAYLKEWGFNVVRLGVMWTGLIPEKNFINQTYLSEIKKIVNSLGENGIYVIIDLHQDMMSSKFDSYDGVPLWILDEMPKSLHDYPWPFKNQSLGFGAYATEACSFAFQCLYDNVNNFETYFHQYWSIMAETFSNYSSVLGYELINEPWAGDIYEFPLFALPGFAGGLNLMPLYDRTYKVIREYDTKTIVMYEPVTWGVMSTGKASGTGFTHPPGWDLKGTALSWHYYCWLYDVDVNPLVNGSLPEFGRIFCEDWQLKDYFSTVEKDMQNLGGGASFLTEFGTCAYGDQHNQNVDECKYILDASDQNFQSWTYWDSDFYFYDTFEVNYQLINAFSRVYPIYTNGIPVLLSYNSTNGYFKYIFEMKAETLEQANLTTEVFVPKHVYPNGFNVNVSEDLRWTFNQKTNRCIFTLNKTVSNKFSTFKNFTYSNQFTIEIMAKLKK